MAFNGCDCKLIKNTDIEKMLVRAMNVYFRQNPDQVYLVIIIVKEEDFFFTIS
jgi:hypothetical protein